jgi:single-stranded-DNA-specific exonuclease
MSSITDLPTAQIAFAAWLNEIDHNGRFVAMHDCDADGVAAGVIWQRGMERLGFANPIRILPSRERNPWTTENQTRVRAANPQALCVLDLGSRDSPLAAGAPSCFIDHHRPEGVPPGALLISAYTWEPILNTSLLMWELMRPIANVDDLDWVAAIGTVSDLGERAPFPMLEAAKKKYTAKYLKEATALVNAARRASTYEPEVAAEALLTHASPRALVDSTSPVVDRLRADRAEVAEALAEAKRAAPKFSGNVALVRIHSACQVHPLIAQIWRSRLPKHIVIAANTGFMPDRVNFSVRSAPGLNVLEFLGGIALDLAEGEGNFGHGHDQASGGSIPPAQWARMLDVMGFK